MDIVTSIKEHIHNQYNPNDLEAPGNFCGFDQGWKSQIRLVCFSLPFIILCKWLEMGIEIYEINTQLVFESRLDGAYWVWRNTVASMVLNWSRNVTWIKL